MDLLTQDNLNEKTTPLEDDESNSVNAVPLPTLQPSNYDTLVVSGGASRGILSLGALQYAYDNFFLTNINTYIGTSAGAMICFFLIIGYTPLELIVYLCTNRILERLQNFNIVGMINGFGASSYAGLQEELEKITIAKIGRLPTMKDLHTKFGKQFICCTYNITNDSSEYLSHETHPDLPCITALRMSSNLPLVFEKFNYNGNFYIDGGIADNFPIDIGDLKGEKVLGLLLDNERENFNKIQDMDIIEYVYNLMNIPSTQSVEFKVKSVSNKCKIIRLTFEKIKIFNFNIETKTKLEMFSSGYQQMKKQIE